MCDDNNCEFFYDPEQYTKFPADKILDEEAGITFGEMNEALRRLSELRGHSGPFNEEEVCNALMDVVVGDAMKGLIGKGLMDSYLGRDGEMKYTLTDLGNKVGEELEKDE